MATAADPTEDEIRRLNRDAAKLEAETRKLLAEAEKLRAEKYKLSAESSKLERDTIIAPWLIVVQALIGGAALFGSALALLKYLAS